MPTCLLPWLAVLNVQMLIYRRVKPDLNFDERYGLVVRACATVTTLWELFASLELMSE